MTGDAENEGDDSRHARYRGSLDRRLIVAMTHCSPSGPKIVKRCTRANHVDPPGRLDRDWTRRHSTYGASSLRRI